MPCYNDGKFIRECLDSVHQQHYVNYEIVVINDGSTDTFTNKVVKGIDHPKITVLETDNQGVSLARNTGIKHSNGKYILPLDADDKIGKNFIGEAVAILESSEETKVVCCDIQLFGVRNEVIQFQEYTLERLMGRNIMTVSSMFRKSDFDQTHGFNPNMKDGFEDWDFWLTLLKTGGSVHKISGIEFYYRIKQNSRNSSLKDKYRKLRRQIYNNHKDLYAQHMLDPLESFEYELITQSREYRLGLFLLKPVRKLYKFFH